MQSQSSVPVYFPVTPNIFPVRGQRIPGYPATGIRPQAIDRSAYFSWWNRRGNAESTRFPVIFPVHGNWRRHARCGTMCHETRRERRPPSRPGRRAAPSADPCPTLPSVLRGAWRGATRAPGIRERLDVRRWPSAKALEQPGAFSLGNYRLCGRTGDRAGMPTASCSTRNRYWPCWSRVRRAAALRRPAIARSRCCPACGQRPCGHHAAGG
jgi:hypothetical protein